MSRIDSLGNRLHKRTLYLRPIATTNHTSVYMSNTTCPVWRAKYPTEFTGSTQFTPQFIWSLDVDSYEAYDSNVTFILNVCVFSHFRSGPASSLRVENRSRNYDSDPSADSALARQKAAFASCQVIDLQMIWDSVVLGQYSKTETRWNSVWIVGTSSIIGLEHFGDRWQNCEPYWQTSIPTKKRRQNMIRNQSQTLQWNSKARSNEIHSDKWNWWDRSETFMKCLETHLYSNLQSPSR